MGSPNPPNTGGPQSPQKAGGVRTPPDGPTGRVRGVQRAAEAKLRKGQVYAVRTRVGDVHIQDIAFKSDKDSGTEWVEVHLAGDTEGGDPHYRIFNPPTLVQDPAGDIEINGRMFREDPLAALAEAVALHGGAVRRKIRGRRR